MRNGRTRRMASEARWLRARSFRLIPGQIASWWWVAHIKYVNVPGRIRSGAPFRVKRTCPKTCSVTLEQAGNGAEKFLASTNLRMICAAGNDFCKSERGLKRFSRVLTPGSWSCGDGRVQ